MLFFVEEERRNKQVEAQGRAGVFFGGRRRASKPPSGRIMSEQIKRNDGQLIRVAFLLSLILYFAVEMFLFLVGI